MKRIPVVFLALLLALALLLCGCLGPAPLHDPYRQNVFPAANPEDAKTDSIRGVWISIYELPKTKGVSKREYEAQADTMFRNLAENGFNTAFVHVRAFADAIYPSAFFPFSALLSGTQGISPDYDPLCILLEAAHCHGIAFHAWINPFRVAHSTDVSQLAADNPARVWLESENPGTRSLVAVLENGIYFNPAATRVHKLVLDGVREIMRNYKVDGIHIDDYFYPTTDPAIDAREYAAYQKAGGRLPLDTWRREMISSFVAGLYDTVKICDPKAVFSISPAGDIARNITEFYADVEEWTRTPGYADMILPQLYYGFEHQFFPFKQVARQWEALLRLPEQKAVWGLAAYKTGQPDAYAGSGSLEWVKHPDVIARQIKFLNTLSKNDGFALFSYNSLFGEDVPKAIQDLLAQLRK